jgi:hypothetical protein
MRTLARADPQLRSETGLILKSGLPAGARSRAHEVGPAIRWRSKIARRDFQLRGSSAARVGEAVRDRANKKPANRAGFRFVAIAALRAARRRARDQRLVGGWSGLTRQRSSSKKPNIQRARRGPDVPVGLIARLGGGRRRISIGHSIVVEEPIFPIWECDRRRWHRVRQGTLRCTA